MIPVIKRLLTKLKILDDNKDAGPDGIYVIIDLKMCLEFSYAYFNYNMSLRTGVF